MRGHEAADEEGDEAAVQREGNAPADQHGQRAGRFHEHALARVEPAGEDGQQLGQELARHGGDVCPNVALGYHSQQACKHPGRGCRRTGAERERRRA